MAMLEMESYLVNSALRSSVATVDPEETKSPLVLAGVAAFQENLTTRESKSWKVLVSKQTFRRLGSGTEILMKGSAGCVVDGDILPGNARRPARSM